jgi:hypothetical protein
LVTRRVRSDADNTTTNTPQQQQQQQEQQQQKQQQQQQQQKPKETNKQQPKQLRTRTLPTVSARSTVGSPHAVWHVVLVVVAVVVVVVAPSSVADHGSQSLGCQKVTLRHFLFVKPLQVRDFLFRRQRPITTSDNTSDNSSSNNSSDNSSNSSSDGRRQQQQRGLHAVQPNFNNTAT